MATFDDTLLDLTRENLQRSYIIKGVYDKLFDILKTSREPYLIELIGNYLTEYPLYRYEEFYHLWFSDRGELSLHNHGIVYDISVIIGFILPYYVDYTEQNYYITSLLPVEDYRVIDTLTDDSLPPAYAVHHVHCMLDILAKKCVKSGKSDSKRAVKQHQKTATNRQLFRYYYLTKQAQSPTKTKADLVEEVADIIRDEHNKELDISQLSNWATQLRQHEFLAPQKQIKLLDDKAKPRPHNIHIRDELKKHIKNMSKISI